MGVNQVSNLILCLGKRACDQMAIRSRWDVFVGGEEKRMGGFRRLKRASRSFGSLKGLFTKLLILNLLGFKHRLDA